MKKQIIAILLLITVFTSLQLRAEGKNKHLIGEWIYEVSNAPYGYEKGSLIFSKKDGHTVCVVKLEAGELTVNDLKIGKGKITFTTSVEGSPVNVELICKNDKMSGKVDSPEGPKSITATKIRK